jgi:hypothetical protein
MDKTDNIFTYLKWRGDLRIKDNPFNEIDALILCEMVYLRFDGIVPGPGEESNITIAKAAKGYEVSKEKNILWYAEKEELFLELAKSPRFGEMVLSDYISTIDVEQRQQFAAMHIQVAPNLTFIAFRGTDETIVGWREDFNMSYMMPVPAQQAAVDYINKTAKGTFRKYWLGGHSKGGNLAIYSAMFCQPKIQKKIVKINSFDGPGFNRKVVNDDCYLAIKEKISAYVPVASIVGMLMEHEEDYKVVESSRISIAQHEGLNWSVCGTAFKLAEDIDKFSRHISVTIQSWLSKVPDEERRDFVNTVFDVLEQSEIRSLRDFSEPDMKKAGVLLKNASKLPQEQRELVKKLIKMFIAEGTKRN